MHTLFVLTFIIWIRVHSVSGATFTAIGNVVESAIFLCGKEVVLTCSESDLVLSMEFTVDGVQVASCTYPSCKSNSDFASNFTMDSTKGIFNFTLHAVKPSDNERVFICNINGQQHKIIPKVAEIPQNQSLTIQDITVQTGTEIKAITGCLFPTSAIHFKWYTVNVSNVSDVMPFVAPDNKTEPNSNVCVQLPDCQGSGLSNTFVIQQSASSSRGEVFLEVHVLHDYSPNQSVAIHRTARGFIISDPITPTTTALPITTTGISIGNGQKTGELSTGVIAGIASACAIIVLVVVVVVILYVLKQGCFRTMKQTEKPST